MEAVLTHGSLFAGIGGQDLGFEQAGWSTIWQVENEPFCRAVLETRFPKSDRSVSDVREAGSRNLARVDCITAGVPCQDVSVAGKRAGLQGERTGLFFEFARILQELRPAWFVFENVPGLLSSNRGRDFAEVLRVLMVDCGYGVCWRVLDSQFFGVAQRRRRVFIVGCLGKPCPAEVLFESKSGAGDSPQGRKARQGIAGRFADGIGGAGPIPQAITTKWSKQAGGPAGDEHHNLVIAPTIGADIGRQAGGHPGIEEYAEAILAATLNSGGNEGGFRTEPGEHIVAQPIRTNPYNNSDPGMEARSYIIQDVRGHREKKQHGIGIQEGGPSYTLDGVSQHAVAVSPPLRSSEGAKGHPGDPSRDEIRAALVACPPPDPDGVRDATGFSEGVDMFGRQVKVFQELLPKGQDSARYRALGNAWTTQVAEWIARRIIGIGGHRIATDQAP